MKLNWGNAIVLAFGLFAVFILSFVFYVQGNAQYDNEMVTDDYYKKDTHFQQDYALLQHTQALLQKPEITTGPQGIAIVFPQDFDPKKITGKVSLYRPSDQKLDCDKPLVLSGHTLLIPQRDLVGGRWDLTLLWQYQGREYLQKTSIYL